jgi:hypothetical protein
VVAVIEDEEEEVKVPLALAAETANVYAVPLCRPVTVNGEAPVAVKLPGVDVAVKVVAVPPVGAAV